MHVSPANSDYLRDLARLHGVQTSYLDMAKRQQTASAESLMSVLRALSVPVQGLGDVPDALREARRALAHQIVEPVHVAWRGHRTSIPLRLPDGAAVGPFRCEWRLEGGDVRAQETRLERLEMGAAQRIEGRRFVTRLVPVPRWLPVGYHVVAFTFGRQVFETHLFCAQERCFQGSGSRRTWGVFAPLYALHSQHSWGAGDFGDLMDLIEWVSNQGGRFVGTLPLLPAFLDRPCEPSPYSPVSRLLWNEFFLDLGRVPELMTFPRAQRLMETATFKERLRTMRQSPLVDYPAQMSLKRSVLERLSKSFFAGPSPRRPAFDRFLRENPVVADYARFRAVHEERGQPWTCWPARMRCGELRDADCRSSVREYHLFVQWLAHEQMAALSEHSRRQNVDLYLDMPLGTHRDGYDAWRYQGLFARDASGGAPPDPVFTEAQDWGFAPMHPQRSREQGHAYFRAFLRHHLQHARILRFDHVMGLHRLYWVPRGLPAKHGAYVRYPAEEFYAILSIESHRHQAIMVGENLGTVPPEVDQGLKLHGIAGMFVVQSEARPAPRTALRRIPVDTLASLNTHDLPPFAAFWEGSDIPDRHDLGLIKRGGLAREYQLRKRVRQSLVRLLRRRGHLRPGVTDAKAVCRAAIEYLGRSAARRVLVNVEDLWLETAPQNTPGTSTERVNWRRKMSLDLERIREGDKSGDSGDSGDRACIPLTACGRVNGAVKRPFARRARLDTVRQ